jgi:F-type H+-transporting ATPase subunit a
MLAHLVPLGSPGALMPFMVLIELVSSFIRPLTLSVRLVANIVAGHLLLTLLRRGRRRAGLLVLSTIILALFLLSCLERAVATIQAYVFTILSTLYVREVDSIAKNS